MEGPANQPVNQPAVRADEKPASQARASSQVTLDAAKDRGAAREGPRFFARAGSTLPIVIASLVVSLVSALYVLCVGTLTHHKKHADKLDEACLYTAQKLAQIYVDHPRFGRVGICDLSTLEPDNRFSQSSPRGKITGIHTLFETLAVDDRIAERLANNVMRVLIANDLAEAKRVEKALVDKLDLAADPNLMPESGAAMTAKEGPGNLSSITRTYRDVYRMLSTDSGFTDYSLNWLKIKMGRSTALGKSWPNGSVRLIDPDSFDYHVQHPAPYAVLIEACYQARSSDPAHPHRVVKRSCALISQPRSQPAPSTFVVNFVDGKPNIFTCLKDLLSYGNWTNSGDWQQATRGEVPGQGSLAPTLEPVLPGMKPSDALSVAFYHWLRQLGPDVSEEQVLRIVSCPWKQNLSDSYSLPQEGGEHQANRRETPNSCLCIDTGAREYSIMFQTGPGGTGQAALARVFDPSWLQANSLTQGPFPQSALPLFVDQKGELRLPGGDSFDSKFVNDYLKAIYQTNLAAVESLAAAKLTLARAGFALKQVDQKLIIESQELNSLRNRSLRIAQGGLEGSTSQPSYQGKEDGGEHGLEGDKQGKLLKAKIEAVSAALKEDIAEHDELKASQKLADVSAAAAVTVATTTFELSAHAFKTCREGICKIDGPEPAYIISKKYIFKPQLNPVDESDFFNKDTVKKWSQPDSQRTIPVWFRATPEILKNVSNLTSREALTMTVGGQPLNMYTHSRTLEPRGKSEVIILSSESLKGSPAPMYFTDTPYSGVRIPKGQLFYYCQDALETGKDPKVSWSVVIRDLVATKPLDSASDQGKIIPGEPCPSSSSDWCKATLHGTCPGMACEFQLRTPLPIIPGEMTGSLVTNPITDSQIQQIPPVPPDML